MGIGFSETRRHILTEFHNPRTRTAELTLGIRLMAHITADGARLVPEVAAQTSAPLSGKARFAEEINRSLGAQERAVVLGVYLLYVQNELSVPITFRVNGLYPAEKRDTDDEEGAEDGFFIPIAANHRGPVPERQRALWQPGEKTLTILRYAGMEEAMLRERSVMVKAKRDDAGKAEEDETEDSVEKGSQEIFRHTDPMVDFVLRHRERLKPTRAQFCEVPADVAGGDPHYAFSAAFLKQVRDFFRQAIFDALRYTRFEDATLTWEMSAEDRDRVRAAHAHPPDRPWDAPNVSFIVQINYLVVAPGLPEFAARSQKLPGL